MKFVLNTRNFGLKIEPKIDNDANDWVMIVYMDSDYAGDKDNWLSVSGFIIFLLGVPIMWRSKEQRSVSLSSAEAEFCSLSDAAKEIKFVFQILRSMGISVKLPVIVGVDNIGAIFMTENVYTNSRTKHVDVRYHFVREFVEEVFVKIVFVRSEHNTSDGFTKNMTGDIYDAHVADYMAERSTIVS
jgi:hypothetical protein